MAAELAPGTCLTGITGSPKSISNISSPAIPVVPGSAGNRTGVIGASTGVDSGEGNDNPPDRFLDLFPGDEGCAGGDVLT